MDRRPPVPRLAVGTVEVDGRIFGRDCTGFPFPLPPHEGAKVSVWGHPPGGDLMKTRELGLDFCKILKTKRWL
jgi:hypothetical protein